MINHIIVLNFKNNVAHILPIDPETFDWEGDEVTEALELLGISQNDAVYMTLDSIKAGWSQ